MPQVQRVFGVGLGGTRALQQPSEEHEDVAENANCRHYPDTSQVYEEVGGDNDMVTLWQLNRFV